MNIKSYYTKLCLVGSGCVVLANPAMAIEKPAEEEAPKEKKKEAVVEEVPKPAKQNTEKFAMLGVGGMKASETLSMHLGIEAGAGLTIYRIVPGSAAEKAGLKTHDVLTEFDGKKIGTQNDLREAVLEKKPGDEVSVKFFSRGKAMEKKLALGAREDRPMARVLPGIHPEWMQKNLGPRVFQGLGGELLPMEKEIKKRMQQMRLQLQEQGGARLNLDDLLKDAQRGDKGDGVFKFNARTSITFMDKEGSITMNTKNGKKSVIVKDKDGKLQFDGPYETEQDKAAVPDDIRDRIDRLSKNEGNGMKLNIQPMGGMIEPLQEEPENPAE